MLILNISTISGGQSFVMQNEVRDCYELGYSSVDQILSLGTCWMNYGDPDDADDDDDDGDDAGGDIEWVKLCGFWFNSH